MRGANYAGPRQNPEPETGLIYIISLTDENQNISRTMSAIRRIHNIYY